MPSATQSRAAVFAVLIGCLLYVTEAKYNTTYSLGFKYQRPKLLHGQVWFEVPGTEETVCNYKKLGCTEMILENYEQDVDTLNLVNGGKIYVEKDTWDLKYTIAGEPGPERQPGQFSRRYFMHYLPNYAWAFAFQNKTDPVYGSLAKVSMWDGDQFPPKCWDSTVWCEHVGFVSGPLH
ncbi:hypothetical protein FQN57_002638 [Myotisia sp. PD_48]|nr:hypothetical protein FQN57_002638 [Myotisia sp. PD_48]